jgi:hypothetical protein
MAPSPSEIQQAIVNFLAQERLVESWLSVEVGPLSAKDGVIEGELFIARRFHDQVTDADLGRVLAEIARAVADGRISVNGASRIEVRGVDDGLFSERHAELGNVRTLAGWLTVTLD